MINVLCIILFLACVSASCYDDELKNKRYNFHDFKITGCFKFNVKQENGVLVQSFDQTNLPYGKNASGWIKIVDVNPKFYQEAFDIAAKMANDEITFEEASALWTLFDEKVATFQKQECEKDRHEYWSRENIE